MEIGGFDIKLTLQNPPCSFLQQECEKTTAFMLRWIPCLPRLVIDGVTVSRAAQGVYEVTATVSNAGFLPTYVSQKAKELKVASTVKVSIDVEDGFLQGSHVMDAGDLSSYGLAPTGEWAYGNITTSAPTKVSTKVRWLIKGKKDSYTVTAWSPAAGKAVFTVKA